MFKMNSEPTLTYSSSKVWMLPWKGRNKFFKIRNLNGNILDPYPTHLDQFLLLDNSCGSLV